MILQGLGADEVEMGESPICTSTGSRIACITAEGTSS